jgi:hypothetical protein
LGRYTVFFLILALTSLLKGLIGFVLPGLVLLPHVLSEQRYKRHLNLRLLLALLIAAAVYATPFVLSHVRCTDLWRERPGPGVPGKRGALLRPVRPHGPDLHLPHLPAGLHPALGTVLAARPVAGGAALAPDAAQCALAGVGPGPVVCVLYRQWQPAQLLRVATGAVRAVVGRVVAERTAGEQNRQRPRWQKGFALPPRCCC